MKHKQEVTAAVKSGLTVEEMLGFLLALPQSAGPVVPKIRARVSMGGGIRVLSAEWEGEPTV